MGRRTACGLFMALFWPGCIAEPMPAEVGDDAIESDSLEVVAPSCRSGSFDPSLLPNVSTPYAPMPWGTFVWRLSATAGLLAPTISDFANYVEGGAGAGTQATWRGRMLSGFGISTLRNMTFPSGLSPLTAPASSNPGVWSPTASTEMARLILQALAQPASAQCTISDFLEVYDDQSSRPSYTANLLTRNLLSQKTGPYAVVPNTNFALLSLTNSQANVLAQNTIYDAANASDLKWRDGLEGMLEGVPFVTKGSFDVKGFTTHLGTRWARFPIDAGRNATVVNNLIGRGGLAVGGLNMHELGGGTTGINPKYGAVRNAYAWGKAAGGSSSAVAAAVAMQYAPIGIGGDAGGSVRIPAAWNGIYGLKPTYGSVSSFGEYKFAPTLGTPGLMARTLRDLWVAAVLTSNYSQFYGGPGYYGSNTGTTVQDPTDPTKTITGSGSYWIGRIGAGENLADFHGPGKPLVIGIHRGWNAQAQAGIKAQFDMALDRLRQAGAVIVQIDPTGKGIPRLEWSVRAQILLWITELSATVRGDTRYRRSETSAEQRIAIAMGQLSTVFDNSNLHASDVNRARLIRRQLKTALDQIFCAGVDVIATPTTGILPVDVQNDAFPDGESDLVTTDKINFYASLANLTGHPAITVPLNSAVGLQLIARPHAEMDLFRVAYAYELRSPPPSARPVATYCPIFVPIYQPSDPNAPDWELQPY